jgi:hypothetical protein
MENNALLAAVVILGEIMGERVKTSLEHADPG